MTENLNLSEKQGLSFATWVSELKDRIKESRLKAFSHVNSEMIRLYWSIGADIVRLKAESEWGSGFYKTLSESLKSDFPDISGFSVTNLKYMKRFYLFYSAAGIRQQAVDEFEKICCVPWGHQILIITKCGSYEESMFYISNAVEHGWSRSLLLNYLDAGLYQSHGRVINNFDRILPSPQSELAEESLKDPYNFDFLSLTADYREKELENALITKITDLLLELGQGFAFVARQYRIMMGASEKYIDLLFYHTKLHCYVVVELKTTEFEPAHIGQLGAYVAAVNHQLKTAEDNATIGLLICKTKDNVVAQYSLEAASQPIGISEYNINNILPADYRSKLPSVSELEEKMKSI